MTKQKFAVNTLKRYAKENSVLQRSTSDLSQLEQWLLVELMKATEIKQKKKLLTEFMEFRDKIYWSENELVENEEIIDLFIKQ